LTKKTVATYKEILALSLPIIAGSAIENITTLTNTAFLGRVGPVALGAAAIGGIFYLALVMIGFGFGIGTQIIIARRFGEKNLSGIGNTLHHAAAFLLPLALLFFVFVLLFGNKFFHYFLDSSSICAGVEQFMEYRIWGIFFAFINILFRAFYIGILKTRVIGISSLIIALTNVFFDYSLIFGNFGLPNMGIAGAGLASVIAEFAGTLFFIIYTSVQKDIAHFNLTRFTGIKGEVLIRIFKVASPVMFQFFVSFSGWFIFFMLVEKMGEVSLAVSNIIRTVYMIVLLPLWGFASATNTLVSYKIGSSKYDEIMPLLRKVIWLTIITTGSLVLLVNVFSNSFFHLYTNNEALITASYPVLIVVSFSSILVSLAVILFNTVSGAGKTMVTLLIEFIVITVYVAWTYYLVHSGKASIAWVWTAEIFYGLAMGLMSWLYLKFGNWQQSKI
jgi:putative MATE family efflux protein